MRLPAVLEASVKSLTSAVDSRALAVAAQRLSARYQSGDFRTPAMTSEIERAAYLLTRLPATFAANRHVFQRIRQIVPTLSIESVLDLGAGPGTSLWAAIEAFPEIVKATAVERDRVLASWGRRLAGVSQLESLRNAEWLHGDLGACSLPRESDLVVLSYTLGEFSKAQAEALVARAIKAAARALVIIEPGTPRAFHVLMGVRHGLISAGMKLVAPCPHHQACPLDRANDWCHFAERVERTAEHRKAKGGELGHEDEKFCYLAAIRPSRTSLPSNDSPEGEVIWPEGRIIRHPLFHPGHVKMSLCTASGLKSLTVSKSQKEHYRAARKSRWGDTWAGADSRE